MKSLYLSEIISIIEGSVECGYADFLVDNVVLSLDKLKDNGVYFDLEEKKDLEIFKKCDNCALVASRNCVIAFTGNVTVIKVDDLEKSMWKFVEYYRALFNIPIVAVTGTCGKTSTKEMIAHILSLYFRTVSTRKSINGWRTNLRYLMEIDDQTEAAVIEAAVAYPGDLITSGRYFRPQIGIITNIGIDHLSGCGNFENYLRAKAEMIVGMGHKGVLILNADDENIKKINLCSFQGKIIYFGIKEPEDFKATNIKIVAEGTEFILQHQGLCHNIKIPCYGLHNVYNALASIAAAHVLGFGIRESGERLKSLIPLDKHLQIFKGINGCIVIDDTWSANPTSTEAALKFLKEIAEGKKTLVVLGDMLLLGESAKDIHRDMGDLVIKEGVNMLVTIGELAGEVANRAMQLGLDRNKISACSNPEEAYKFIQPLLNQDMVVLIKKSMKKSFGNLVKMITPL